MNSKIVIFVLVASFCILATCAVPVVEQEIPDDGIHGGVRHKRQACDSNDECRAHCILNGNSGGQCISGSCFCSK